MDRKTKQLYAEPGPNRVSLGKFVPEQDVAKAVAEHAAQAPANVVPSISSTPNAAVVTASNATQPPKHWFDKLSIRGYAQLRHTSLFDQEDGPGDAGWFHPADRSVSNNETFLLRRARIIFSGDVTDHLYVYVQPELNAAPSDGDFSAQMRDYYSDIAFDAKKEWRLRAGQSKVPYGFSNLQSSQNRLALERPDGINNAVEGERDIGVYMMWAPAEIRERFRTLVSSGLKGSGDYGVVAVGGYNGQGLNRTDTNDSLHTVARMSYPFKFESGQYFEPGIQAYTGKFVPRTSAITVNDTSVTPTFDDKNGIRDERVGLTAVLYPQPFGLEAEWNFGQSPELSGDYQTIDERSMNGGYVLASYKIDMDEGATLFPFVRWQYLDGGRKFGRNAPNGDVDEWDFGMEWSPWKEVELTAQYSFSHYRTNSNTFPYDEVRDGHRLGLQLQWNY